MTLAIHLDDHRHGHLPSDRLLHAALVLYRGLRRHLFDDGLFLRPAMEAPRPNREALERSCLHMPVMDLNDGASESNLPAK